MRACGHKLVKFCTHTTAAKLVVRMYIASIFFANLVLHLSSIINKIVINIMIIEVMYTVKSQHSFVDSRRRDDTYRFIRLAGIQSQSRTTGDLEYLHGNNRGSCRSTLLTKDSCRPARRQLQNTRRCFEIGGVRPKISAGD